MDISTEKQVNPNLLLSDRGLGRYPNQFFDLSQQYMPPTIKELFRWCTFYYYNSPLIGSSITKISRYPITSLIYEDEHDSVRELWSKIFDRELKIRDQLLEVNLDYHVYGNAFVSIHLPFTRFLICLHCKHREPISQWDWDFNSGSYNFRGKCGRCGESGELDVNDVPYKDRKKVRIIRWNPENIHVKFNEYTGRRIYMYSVPYKLRNAIQRGDKDILEDIPLVVLKALKERRMIRFNDDNFKHLRRPTLAEQDQGWGKPLIIHVLKDMFYLYTLRRAQEAIALEHIVPFDMIYPMPNAQQDPYIHVNLANWRSEIENVIKRHRRDPNFKAVVPIPVGFGRLGGDGKAMMLTPELNYLTQTIVGGMGIPQEFLFGGLNYTGSSISLRTLENDFIQNRSQLLDLVLWIKDKIRVWMTLPNIKNIKFADFRMADDVQRNQQLIGLNAQQKVSDQTLLTELGYDWEQEQRKMLEEAHFRNYLNDLVAKGSAKTQGEASLIQFNYQQKIQEMSEKAQREAMTRIQSDPSKEGRPLRPGEEPQPIMRAGWEQMAGSELEGQGAALPAPAGGMGQEQPAQAEDPVQNEVDQKVRRWALKISQMDPNTAIETLSELKQRFPELGAMVEKAYNSLGAEIAAPSSAPAVNPNSQVQQVNAPSVRKAPQGGQGLV